MEAVRPDIGAFVLDRLRTRLFGADDFFETRQGVCRLMPPLPQTPAELAPRLAKLAAPVVEQVAHRLAHGRGTAARPLTVPTLLTQANRSAGRDRVRTTPKGAAKPEKLAVPAACRECGVILEGRDRQYCDECLPTAQQEQVTAFGAAGRAKLAELRAAGKDPSQGGEVAKRRAAKIVQRMQDQAAWEAEHGAEADTEVFRQEILPHLQNVSLGLMAKATGLSEGYCSFVRRGIKVPHRRHWDALCRMGEHQNRPGELVGNRLP